MNSLWRRAAGILLLATSTWLAHTSPAEARGEDFPFFCRIEQQVSVVAFKVNRDTRSSSGYTLISYTAQGDADIIPASVDRTKDGKYIVITAVKSSNLPMIDRRTRAFINVIDAKNSAADYHLARHNAPMDFDAELGTASCTPAAHD